MDDNLIKPVDAQSIFSIKSAKDKNLNDKKKRQNTGSNHSSEDDFSETVVFPNEEVPEDNKNKNGLDFCA